MSKPINTFRYRVEWTDKDNIGRYLLFRTLDAAQQCAEKVNGTLTELKYPKPAFFSM